MGITFGDYLIDSGYYDPPEEEAMPFEEKRFVKSPTSIGWPEPTCGDVSSLSNRDLADYIAACGSDFDGLPRHAREALVRLLLYYQAFEPPKRSGF